MESSLATLFDCLADGLYHALLAGINQLSPLQGVAGLGLRVGGLG